MASKWTKWTGPPTVAMTAERMRRIPGLPTSAYKMQIVSKVIHTIREKIHILSTTTNINQKKIQMPRLPPSASNFPENSNCSKVKTQIVKKKRIQIQIWKFHKWKLQIKELKILFWHNIRSMFQWVLTCICIPNMYLCLIC